MSSNTITKNRLVLVNSKEENTMKKAPKTHRNETGCWSEQFLRANPFSGVKEIIAGFVVAATVFFMLTVVGGSAKAMIVEGSYTVAIDWGIGGGQDLGKFNLSDGPSAPLAYDETKTFHEVGSASAAFGIWGSSDPWGFWLTEGTGVGQYDPNHQIGETVMTMTMDMYLRDNESDNDLYGKWYDWINLQGTVGGLGSYVGFTENVKMYTGTTGGVEEYQNQVNWAYENTTPGQFYIASGRILPAPDFDKMRADGEYMHFTGTYIFYANNDGGPSSISFSQNSPPPVPEPSTLLLLCGGVLAMVGVRRKNRAKE
jgi:hypothetical protein